MGEPVGISGRTETTKVYGVHAQKIEKMTLRYGNRRSTGDTRRYPDNSGCIFSLGTRKMPKRPLGIE